MKNEFMHELIEDIIEVIRLSVVGILLGLLASIPFGILLMLICYLLNI
jgi:ABC-type phosphate/phosphonate transport system permease subunit